MKSLNWKSQLADYIKNPQFISYGSSDETRPVLVDCSLGINPLDLYAGQKVELDASRYARYPADGHRIKDLAQYVHARFPAASPDALCFGAGSQGAISGLSRILGGGAVKVLGLAPTFIPALMEFATAGAKVEILKMAGPDYRVDIDAVIAALTDDATLVYLDNPNNPTGQVTPLAELDRLALACAERGTLLMVDEAYSDFVDDRNSALLLTHRNVICTRSFSKGCGLAGARTGYIMIRDPELRQEYLKTALLFSSSAAAADLAARLLPGLDLEAMRRGVTALKNKVLSLIAGYPQFKVAATAASTPILYLLWAAKPDGDLYDALMDVGVMTEAGGPFFGLEGKNAVRLRVPPHDRLEEFQRLWRKRFD